MGDIASGSAMPTATARTSNKPGRSFNSAAVHFRVRTSRKPRFTSSEWQIRGGAISACVGGTIFAGLPPRAPQARDRIR